VSYISYDTFHPASFFYSFPHENSLCYLCCILPNKTHLCCTVLHTSVTAHIKQGCVNAVMPCTCASDDIPGSVWVMQRPFLLALRCQQFPDMHCERYLASLHHVSSISERWRRTYQHIGQLILFFTATATRIPNFCWYMHKIHRGYEEETSTEAKTDIVIVWAVTQCVLIETRGLYLAVRKQPIWKSNLRTELAKHRNSNTFY
jgi:hypothetical protein